jgi:transposase-like protein
VKNGANFSQDGVEVLFRLFDGGAGYNSAARKLGVTQSAIKRWKGKYAAETNGPNREKHFVPWLDTKTA